MLGTMELIIHLAKISLFSGLQARELSAIASIVKEKIIPTRTVIIQEGEPGEFLYLILKGRVSVFKSWGTPKELHLADIEQDDYVGEIALFDDQPRAATVVTQEETQVLELSHFEFQELMRAYPKIAIHACAVFSRRIRELQAKMRSVQYSPGGSS